MTSKLKMRYLSLKYVSMKVDLDKHLFIVVILVKYGKILRFERIRVIQFIKELK